MKYDFGKTVVLALGGSVMFPEQIDVGYIRRFRKFILPWTKRKKFVVVAGGGKLSRIFQRAAGEIAPVSDYDKDWIGIHATRLNAQLLRTIFVREADHVVWDAREKVRRPTHPITIASGWRPGWSTDYIAVAIARELGAKEAVIAGKPSFVYDKDHALHADARPLPELSWGEYQKLIPAKWVPGAHAPVDPVAARLAKKSGLKAIVIGGKDLANFGRLLAGESFRGSVIK